MKYEEANTYANNYNMSYFEVSSLTGENVNTTFEMMNANIIEYIKNNPLDDLFKSKSVIKFEEEPSGSYFSWCW